MGKAGTTAMLRETGWMEDGKQEMWEVGEEESVGRMLLAKRDILPWERVLEDRALLQAPMDQPIQKASLLVYWEKRDSEEKGLLKLVTIGGVCPESMLGEEALLHTCLKEPPEEIYNLIFMVLTYNGILATIGTHC